MKRNYRHINSLSALKAEQLILKNQYLQQEARLRDDVSTYIKQLSPIYLFKKYFTGGNLGKVDDHYNLSGKLMSLVLPLFLNKTLFRGSGFITKAIVGLMSNRLGKKLDLDHLAGIVDKVKGFFKKKEDPKPRLVDYGIPPDSETY